MSSIRNTKKDKDRSSGKASVKPHTHIYSPFLIRLIYHVEYINKSHRWFIFYKSNIWHLLWTFLK